MAIFNNKKTQTFDHELAKKYIHNIYSTILHRSPDQDGLSTYLGHLRAGSTPITILKAITSSEESRSKNNADQIRRINELINKIEKHVKEKDFIESIEILNAELISVYSPDFNDFNLSKQMALKYVNQLQLKLSEDLDIIGIRTKSLPGFAGFSESLSSMDINPEHISEIITTRFSGEWIKNYFILKGEERTGDNFGVANKISNYIMDKLSSFDGLPEIDKNKMIFIGLTTLGRPSLAIAIKSLLNQSIFSSAKNNVKIVVNVPKNISADKVKDLIQKSTEGHLGENIIINKTDDFGPITKLIGTISIANNFGNDSIICLADDDVYYKDNHFSVLVKYFLWLDGRVAIGTSGFDWQGYIKDISNISAPNLGYKNVEGHLSNVDIIETWCGVCLSSNWFANDFIETVRFSLTESPDILRQDDVFYSTYLEYLGIDRIILNSDSCNRYEVGFSNETNEISILNKGHDSLNGSGELQMNWVRTAEYLLAIQNQIFTRCKTNKNKKKIAVATICVGEEYTDDMWPGMQSKARYCERHGYDFLISTEKLDPNLPLIWSKFIFIIETLKKGYDYIYYADADVIITNPTKKIESFFQHEGGSILATSDINGLNIGNMMIANTPTAKEVITQAMKMKEYHFHSPWYEQAALAKIIRERPDLANKEFVICSKNTFNSYINDWRHNDFAVHLAGVYGKYNRLLMDIIYSISRCEIGLSEHVISLLSPFFSNYTQDPNRDINLIPSGITEKDIGKDIYVSLNNRSNKRRVCLLGGIKESPVPNILKAHNSFTVLSPDDKLFIAEELAVDGEKILAIDLTGNDELLETYADKLISLVDLSVVYTTNSFDNLEDSAIEKIYKFRERFKNISLFLKYEYIRSCPNDVMKNLGRFLRVSNLCASYLLSYNSCDNEYWKYFGYRICSGSYRKTFSPDPFAGFGLSSLPSTIIHNN